MQNIKSFIFTYLTQRQKSQLLGTLKAYHKKFENLSVIDLADKFLEDERYYLEINNPHFEFVKDYFEDDQFYRNLKKFFEYLNWEKEQKKMFQPLIDKQKEFAKIQRKKIQD